MGLCLLGVGFFDYNPPMFEFFTCRRINSRHFHPLSKRLYTNTFLYKTTCFFSFLGDFFDYYIYFLDE